MASTSKSLYYRTLEHEDWGECVNDVYALPETEILAEKDLHVNLAVNEYGKGRGVYMNGLPFSFENVRLLYRAIFFAAHKEEEMKRWYSDNYNVDINVYPSTNSFCVVNNTMNHRQLPCIRVMEQVSKLNWMLVKSNGLKFKNQSIKIRTSQLVLNSFGAEYLGAINLDGVR